jgi:hypothetical protein
MTPREGETYRATRALSVRLVLIDGVMDDGTVLLRTTDGSGGLTGAYRMTVQEFRRIVESDGLELVKESLDG